MKRIFSPYRICPIGAHVDHQGGVVLGRTIDLGTTLSYEPLDSNQIHITSDQFGEVKFTIGDLDQAHWSRYAQAAARVLDAKRGIKAHVSGSLIGSGLSSSASVGLAFLKALADINDMELSAEQLVHLDYELEHEQLGLQNGLLDPMSIVYGKKNTLLFMDTSTSLSAGSVTASVTPIADPLPSGFAWVVAYSGVSRELTKSGFNVRVEECRQAAEALIPATTILGDVPREIYEDRKNRLPDNLRKRAAHFFTETDRVREGAKAWYEANLEVFGQLMNESCESSITNYEVGSDILIELHELISSMDGVYGSRFSGGGYGGCVVALAHGASADNICAHIAETFSSRHPELPSKVFIAGTVDGLFPSPISPVPNPLARGTGEQGAIPSAILLAAGRGKRQRPYTDVTPKPLLEVNGRATLDYVLQAVVKAGIRRVCIVTNHLEEKIFEYVGDGSKWNISVTFAHQSELRGNGDALKSVPTDWIRDEQVMILATDYILDEDALLQLVDAHKKYKADITMSLKECPIEELTARSSVDVGSNWQVKRIIEKPRPAEIMSPYAASIMFIFPPQIWDYVAKLEPSSRGEIEMQSAIQEMIEDGYKAYGVLQPAPQEWDAERHLKLGT